MGNIIKTKFDGAIEEDVSFENSEEVVDIEETLKSSENILKGFMYLKEMFSSAPTFNKIIKINYIEDADKEKLTIEKETNLITFKNNKDDTSEVYYNDNDKLLLYPYEQLDIPIFEGDEIKITGTLNVIQMKYEVR